MTTPSLDEIRLLAHRGASARYPEHTRAAYAQAIEDGADGIECDVRLSADGEVVCWHDSTLDRTTGVSGKLAERALTDLRSLDLFRGAEIPARFGGVLDQLMTLTELLELTSGAGRPLLLAVELKSSRDRREELVDAVLATLDRAGWDSETGVLGTVRISLMAFDPAIVDLLAARVPPRLVMLLAEADDARRDAALARFDRGEVQAGPELAILRQEPERARRWVDSGTLVRVWTVDEPSDLDFCRSLGVREITTNRPAELRVHLRGDAPTQ